MKKTLSCTNANLSEFFNNFNLGYKLSFDLPIGFETAEGLTDNTQEIVFLNSSIKCLVQKFFVLLHEIRHAYQFTNINSLESILLKSLSYAIMYNGDCYYLLNNQWHKSTFSLNKAEGEFYYKASPNEHDANLFAKNYIIDNFILSKQEQEKLEKLYEDSTIKHFIFNKKTEDEFDVIYSKIKNGIKSINKNLH